MGLEPTRESNFCALDLNFRGKWGLWDWIYARKLKCFDFIKKYDPTLILFRIIPLIFDFVSRFWHFLTTRHYVNLQNTIISFEDIDFWPRIYLIWYPSLENSTTHITIVQANLNFFDSIIFYPFLTGSDLIIESFDHQYLFWSEMKNNVKTLSFCPQQIIGWSKHFHGRQTGNKW